jgi:hypothetical protein
MFGNYFPSVGPEPLVRELRRAREILDRRAA